MVFCILSLIELKNGGKLAVLGSCHMFSDQYLDKEENSKIMVSSLYCFPDFGHSENIMVILLYA